MEETTRYRRNTVVLYESQYGRISRVLPDMKYEVYCCGSHRRVVHHSDLIVDGYKGRWRWQHHPDNEYDKPVIFDYMPTLRRLKQMRGRYEPVFQKLRKINTSLPTVDFNNANKLFHSIIDHERASHPRRRVFSHFNGKILRDHNVYRHYVRDNVIATMFRAGWKPNIIRGSDWVIRMYLDSRVATVEGNLEAAEREIVLCILETP